MFKIDLPPDPKEMAAIESRRKRESERLARIMNKADNRGPDIEALQQQVCHKNNF